jgi:hypothetical protein
MTSYRLRPASARGRSCLQTDKAAIPRRTPLMSSTSVNTSSLYRRYLKCYPAKARKARNRTRSIHSGASQSIRMPGATEDISPGELVDAQ